MNYGMLHLGNDHACGVGVWEIGRTVYDKDGGLNWSWTLVEIIYLPKNPGEDKDCVVSIFGIIFRVVSVVYREGVLVCHRL